jgi:hypothetical protein
MSLALSRAVDYEATVLSSRVPWLEHRTLVYDMIFFMGIILQSTYIETTSYIELACGIESEQRLILKVSTVNYRTSAAFQSAHRVWVYLLLQEAFFCSQRIAFDDHASSRCRRNVLFTGQWDAVNSQGVRRIRHRSISVSADAPICLFQQAFSIQDFVFEELFTHPAQWQ